MTTRRLCGLRLLLPGAVLLLPLLAIAAFADAFHHEGFRYTSPGQIQEAQRILEAEDYLQAGHYTPREMDQRTIEALRDFQRAHFMPSNGSLDHDTMAELTTHYSAPAIARETASAPPAQEARKESEAAVAPAPAPAPVEKAPVEPTTAVAGTETAPAEEPQAQRSMPATASPVPLMAALGVFLLGAGLLFLRRKRA